ncbi:unnamed protein product [Caenorhabditis nigoni]
MEKTWICDECVPGEERRFYKKDELQKHAITHWKHRPPPFRCFSLGCTEEFVEFREMKAHIVNSHEGSMICNSCNVKRKDVLGFFSHFYWHHVKKADVKNLESLDELSIGDYLKTFTLSTDPIRIPADLDTAETTNLPISNRIDVSSFALQIDQKLGLIWVPRSKLVQTGLPSLNPALLVDHLIRNLKN